MLYVRYMLSYTLHATCYIFALVDGSGASCRETEREIQIMRAVPVFIAERRAESTKQHSLASFY
jgi:hypothetical protein